MQIQKITEFNDYRAWLEHEFAKRNQKNPYYSLRAFSKTLQMSVAQLSRILSGTRTLTVRASESISEALNLSPEEKNHLIHLIIEQHQKLYSVKSSSAKIEKHSDDFLDLSVDAFTAISKWHHYAITELTFLKTFKSEPTWIAKTLGITTNEARAAIGRLKRLGFLEEKKGHLTKATQPLTTTHDVPSSAIRSFHREVLEKAILSLEQHTIHERDMSSMVMAIDPKNIKSSKEKIKKFRRALCTHLETGNPSRIYNLGIQLFPLSKGEM